MKKHNRQFGRVLSLVLSVAMLVAGLPADLLGGAAGKAEAADAVTVDTSGSTGWSASGDTMTRVTKWNFVNQNTTGSNIGIAQNDGIGAKNARTDETAVDSIIVKSTTVELKKSDGDNCLTLRQNASIAIPLDKDTDSVTLKVAYAGSSDLRALIVGEGTNTVSIAYKKTDHENGKGDYGPDSNKIATATPIESPIISGTKGTSQTLVLTSGAFEGGTPADIKIASFELTETKAAGSSEPDPTPATAATIKWDFNGGTQGATLVAAGKTGTVDGKDITDVSPEGATVDSALTKLAVKGQVKDNGNSYQFFGNAEGTGATASIPLAKGTNKIEVKSFSAGNGNTFRYTLAGGTVNVDEMGATTQINVYAPTAGKALVLTFTNNQYTTYISNKFVTKDDVTVSGKLTDGANAIAGATVTFTNATDGLETISVDSSVTDADAKRLLTKEVIASVNESQGVCAGGKKPPARSINRYFRTF